MKGKDMKKKMVKPVASIFLLIMILSIFGAQLLFGQKEKGCVGSGKSVCEKTCSWYENGSVKSISCRVDLYALNNTLKCRCCKRESSE